jgi:hypothetical protein
MFHCSLKRQSHFFAWTDVAFARDGGRRQITSLAAEPVPPERKHSAEPVKTSRQSFLNKALGKSTFTSRMIHSHGSRPLLHPVIVKQSVQARCDETVKALSPPFFHGRANRGRAFLHNLQLPIEAITNALSVEVDAGAPPNAARGAIECQVSHGIGPGPSEGQIKRTHHD